MIALTDPEDPIEREKLLITLIQPIRHPLVGIKMNSDLPYYVIYNNARATHNNISNRRRGGGGDHVTTE